MIDFEQRDILEETDKAALKQKFAEVAKSHRLAAKVLFPERFHRPFSDSIHQPIFEILDDRSVRKAVIIAPRGIGKTSIINMLCPAISILFRLKSYIVPVSCSETVAVQQSENLKMKLFQSAIIQQISALFYGRSLRSDDKFSKEQWVALNGLNGGLGTIVFPRGADQQVMGMLYGDKRPDLILVDDLEDPRNLDSEEQREKKKKRVLGDLFLCVDAPDPDWRIIMLGTLLHPKALIGELYREGQNEASDWVSVKLSICSEQFVSNWPEFRPTADIKSAYAEAERLQTLSTFYAYFMSKAVVDSERGFEERLFQKYEEDEKWFIEEQAEFQNIVIVDPARTTNEGSCPTAITGVSVNAYKQKLYFRRCIKGKMFPDEQYEAIVSMALSIRATTIGIETRGLHDFILQPFRSYFQERGHNFEIIECKALGGKDKENAKVARGRGLLSYYRLKQVWHNRAFAPMIEGPLLEYPFCEEWDVVDTFAYIPQLMAEGEIYFYPPGKGDSPQDVQKEFDSLYKDYENETDDFDAVFYRQNQFQKSLAEQRKVRVV